MAQALGQTLVSAIEGGNTVQVLNILLSDGFKEIPEEDTARAQQLAKTKMVAYAYWEARRNMLGSITNKAAALNFILGKPN